MLTSEVLATLQKAYVAGDLGGTFLAAGIPQNGENILTDDDTFNDTAAVNTGGGPANTAIVTLGNLVTTYNLFASGQNVDNLARNLSGNIPSNTIFILSDWVFDVSFVLPPTFNNVALAVDAQALKLAGQILLQSTKINVKVNSRDRFAKTLSKWVPYRYPAYLNQIANQVAPTPVQLSISSHEEVTAIAKPFDNPITFPTANPIGSTLITNVPQWVQSVYGANIPASVAAALAIPIGMQVDMDFSGVSVKPVG